MKKEDDLILELRKELHQHPELSGQEFNTVKRIKQFIQAHYPCHFIEAAGGCSLLAVYKFSEAGKTVGIRCELDALPIEETNKFDYKSKTKGVAHKCGHDGHMAIVAGLIFWIKKQKFKTGKIVLIFQSAEETGKGAHQLVKDARFTKLNIDYLFSLHNIPGTPLNSIISVKSGFSASVISFSLHLKGKEAHAAEPENGINPAIGVANITKALSDLGIENEHRDDFSVLTPIYVRVGEKSYGISPGLGEIHYTIRCWSDEAMNDLKVHIESIIAQICATQQLQYTIDWFEYFPASKNDTDCNELIKSVAKSNGFELIEQDCPFRFGEDFGWFSKSHKTAMFGLGAGVNSPALHHANYDFPDELIPTGIKMFAGLINQVLSIGR